MKETIEGRSQIENGVYTFQVVGKPEKIRLSSGHTKRIWTLSWEQDGQMRRHKFHLFPTDYLPIVLALGGVKNGSNVDWDDEEVEGMSFSCKLTGVPSKDGKYINYKFENCKLEAPF